MELSDSKRMKAADEEAIQDRGISSLKLMETAAGHLAGAAVEFAGEQKSAVVFCGPGNNGGDGIAAARILLQMGFQVRCFLVGDREKMTEDARSMARELHTVGSCLESFSASAQVLPAILEKTGVILDALFGIGLKRPLQGEALEAVRMMNSAGRPVIAADIPSGISADTGAVMGEAVHASCTVTFSMAKPGHFTEPGCLYRGDLRVCDIGIPQDILQKAGSGIYAIEAEDLALPERQPLTHKGDYGRLLIMAGSRGYTGAASLCAQAAVRGGAGLVYLAVPEDIYEIEAMHNQEAIVFPMPGNSSGRFSREAIPYLEKNQKTSSVRVIGPGLGRDEDTAALTEEVLKVDAGPVVADADALWAIACHPEILQKAAGPVVLTPHEGEFARLLGRAVDNRLEDAGGYAREHQCAVVLKGYRTICAFPDGKAYIIQAGNPGMATGGTGDVLAGVLGALLCQLPPRRAVVTGCWLHARAGDLAAEKFGQYALKAGDLLEFLPQAEKEIIRGRQANIQIG